MGLAPPIGAPAQRKAEEVNAGAAPGVLPTERDHPCLLRCHLQSTRAQPWPQLLREALGLLLILKRGHQIIRVPNQTRFPSTGLWDHVCAPPITRVVQEPLGPEW